MDFPASPVKANAGFTDGKSRTMGKAEGNTGNEQPFNSATVHKISKEMGVTASDGRTRRTCPASNQKGMPIFGA